MWYMTNKSALEIKAYFITNLYYIYSQNYLG